MNQTIPYDLLSRGYHYQTCIDFSQVVVDLMISRHPETLSSVRWLHGDPRCNDLWESVESTR
jgi:EEF1A lysine methyltransferase 4